MRLHDPASIVRTYIRDLRGEENYELIGEGFLDPKFSMEKRDKNLNYFELPADMKRLVDDIFTVSQRYKDLKKKYGF